MKIAILSISVAGHTKSSPHRIRYNTADRMAEKGHDVTFMVPGKPSLRAKHAIVNTRFTRIYTPGILSAHMRRGGFSFLDMLYKSYFVLRNKFDVIQVVGGHRPANFLPCLLAKYIRRSIIVDECWEWLGRGGFADNPGKGLFSRAKAFYDALFDVKLNNIYDDIIVISTELKNRFNNEPNVTVIHGGAETENLKDYTMKDARNKLGIDPSHFIVGMSNVAPMDHYANQSFFESLPELLKKHDHVRLLVTGPDTDYIQEIVSQQHLKDRIIYPGWLDFNAYNTFLSACNLFVLPYPDNTINKARWPNKISDYFCLNRPVITNPTGDVKKYFEKYRLGILCENKPDAYVKAVEILMRQKNALKYCSDALFIATNELSFNCRVDKFLRIFTSRMSALQRKGV